MEIEGEKRMSFAKYIKIELTKLKRSHIIWILIVPVVILWIPSIINSHMNFDMAAEGISPEDNFFIQGFMGFAWFMMPASVVVGTVLLVQTERAGGGIRKMLSLPVRPAALCLSKFSILLLLTGIQVLFLIAMYFLSGTIASQMCGYDLLLDPLTVIKEAVILYVSSIPMTSVFWLIAVLIKTPSFSVGAGLASIVPSVLIMNTKLWFIYPMCYPFYIVTVLQGEMAKNFDTFTFKPLPFLPVAAAVTVVCILIAAISFGKEER